jgi:FAD/FMN-containing dehydrogenase
MLYNPAMNSDLFERLAALLGPKGFSTDPDTLAPHLSEWRGRFQGHTPFLAMPASAEETANAVRLCAEAGVPITPQGGNTGLVGGQIPMGEVLISTRRMSAVRSVDPVDDSITAEAGATLASVQAAAEAANRLFPLSLASEGSATIGGLISTNAGGVHVVRYGMMRDLVLGLEAVLPDGRLWNGLSTLRKDNTGYDLKHMLIGAEGTLGIVTAATLKLYPRPRAHVTALASVASAERALELLHRVKGGTGALAAFEAMNRMSVALTVKNVEGAIDPMPEAALLVLMEFETAAPSGLRELVEATLGEALEAGDAENVLIAENEAQRRAFWHLRESLSAGHRREGAQINHDISTPVSAAPAFLAEAGAKAEALCPGVRIVAFGHMGDGNVHYSVLAPEGSEAAAFPREAIAHAVNETAVALSGSISAEHGIGAARRADLQRYKQPLALDMMRAVKAALDPDGRMNPRVLIP